MGNNACPACAAPLAVDDISVREGVGLCRACGKLSRLGEITDQPEADPSALTRPPAGCSYEAPFGGSAVVRASTRSVGGAAGALFACLFWNGIVSIFVLIAATGLYTHFVGPLPEWFPAPGESRGGRNTGPGMPLGMNLFLCLFLTPFVLIGAGLFFAFLLCAAGRVEVVVSGPDGRVRSGVGPFNWTRRFAAGEVRRIRVGHTSDQENGRTKELIQIETPDQTVQFGSMLPEARRRWMMAALQQVLVTGPKRGGGARRHPAAAR